MQKIRVYVADATGNAGTPSRVLGEAGRELTKDICAESARQGGLTWKSGTAFLQ
jgi:hypothetical protein